MVSFVPPAFDAAHALDVVYDRPVFGHITGDGDPSTGGTVRLLVVGHDRRAWAAASAVRWRAMGFDFAEPYWARVESEPAGAEFDGPLVHAVPDTGGADNALGVRWLHPQWWDEWPEGALMGSSTTLYSEPTGQVAADPTAGDPTVSDIPVLVVHVVG